MSLFSKPSGRELGRDDMAYVSPVAAAQVVEPAPAAIWAVYLMLAALAVALAWAAFAQVDIVAKAPARVVPEGREQVIASLEGGILRELLVREGQVVAKGQPLALLDPTRVEAQQAEGQTRRSALQAAVIRLTAEVAGKAPGFPDELPAAVVEAEMDSYAARQRSLSEAVAAQQRSIALLNRELGVAESMSSKGLMSEVEVMRLKRQANELQLQVAERGNRFRQDAQAELVKARNELALLDEQMVVRDDAMRRSTLVSPVKGIVKVVRHHTPGGIVAPGATVMEVVPIADSVLIEARVQPADIGFVRVGQPVEIKLSAYEYTIFGALKGRVEVLSPDALGDPERAAQPGGTWYRALVRADVAGLEHLGQLLPVMPGMAGSAEIRTGQRSVMRFLLTPMLKSGEAFRER
ncbi:MAG: HlyD family efflux transporter periplasmic adaptor subunit [Rubrivivax sp.]|nr:HlyD family efflux transporter periplasmic adaptor subunit [Rubrivivax sp.]